MTKYMIPDVYKDGFRIFLSLEQEIVNKLISEIENSPDGILPQELPERLREVLPVEIDDLEEIVPMLFSLYRAKDSSGEDVQEFADGIFSAIEQDVELKSLISGNSRENLCKVLAASGPFLLTLKAIEFARERERLTASTRIITDIRPILSEKEKLLGSIVIHDLRIVYQEGEQMQKAHFALDKGDLKQLKEAIERAENTEKLIRKTFSSAENVFIEVN